MGPMMLFVALALGSQAAEWTPDQRELGQQLAEDVADYRKSLPAREGPLTITEVQLHGLEIVYSGLVDSDFEAANIAAFRTALNQGLCTADTAQTIRRGGAFTYDLRDVTGERFVTTVSRCD